MADVKVTRDCYVPKENVKLYVSYETNPVVLDVRRKKRRTCLCFYLWQKDRVCDLYKKWGTRPYCSVGRHPASKDGRIGGTLWFSQYSGKEELYLWKT